MLAEVRGAVIVVGLIPLLWSGAVAALRAGTRARADIGIQGMRMEAAVLELMLAPVPIGVVMLALGPTLTRPPQPLLERTDLASLLWLGPDVAGSSGVAGNAISWQWLPIAAIAVYVLGLAVAATRLVCARVRLHRIAVASIPCPGLGADVRLSSQAGFPFACAHGIVLPRRLATALSGGDVLLVIRHERAHIERGDPRTYWLLAWIDALFWFNPLICRQTMRCRLGAELACDAAVVAGAPEARAAYAGALVAALRDAAQAPACAPGMSSTRHNAEHHLRIRRILDPAPVRPSGLGRLILVTAALLVVPVSVLQLDASAAQAHAVISFELPHPPQRGFVAPSALPAQPRPAPINPASVAAVRRMSDEFVRGQPAVLAPVMRKLFAKLGTVESITFVGVYATGADVFDVRHANGIVRWDVILAPDGTTSSVHLFRKLDSGDTMFWGTFNP